MSTRKTIAIFSLVGVCTVLGAPTVIHAQDDSKQKDQKETKNAAGPDSEKKGDESSTKDGSKDESESSKLPFEATGPVAVVDGETISANAYNQEVEKLTEKMGPLGGSMGYGIATRMKDRLVDQLVKKHLIERETKNAGIEATDKEIDEKTKELKKRLSKGLGDDRDFEWYLEQQGLDKKAFREKVEKQVKLEKLLEKRGGTFSVSEKEAKKYYEQHKERYSQPKKVRARHILIKIDAAEDAPKQQKNKAEKKAKKRAQELAKKARNSDVPFAKLAREHSDGPSASKGGDLGYFQKERMANAFSEKAFNMKPGTVSDPVKTPFGYHVIYVLDTKPAETKSFAEVKEQIISRKERTKKRDALRKMMKELESNAEIEKKTDNIVLNVEKPEGGRGSRLQELRQKLKERQQQQQNQQKDSPESSGPKEKPSGDGK